MPLKIAEQNKLNQMLQFLALSWILALFISYLYKSVSTHKNPSKI